MKNISSKHPVTAEKQIPTGNHKCAQIKTDVCISTRVEKQTIEALNITSALCLENIFRPRYAEIGRATLYQSSLVLTCFMEKAQDAYICILFAATVRKDKRQLAD